MIDLRLGDCLEVMKSIADNSVDAIITDPPYGTTACKWDSVIPFDKMWEQLNRIIKPNGAIVLFGSEPFSSALRMSNIKNYKYDWIWNKKKPVGSHVAKYRPLQLTEIVSVFGNERINYYPIMSPRDKPRIGGKEYGRTQIIGGKINELKNINKVHTTFNPRNLIEFSNASNKDRFHPTQKPILLMEYLIRTYTNENETVLDFTMGSGSTGVAAKNLNRNFIGIEQDENYFNIATDRISKEEKQLKIL